MRTAISALASLLKLAAGPLVNGLRAQALSRPEIVRYLRLAGVDTLSDAFGSIYVHAFLELVERGFQEAALAILRDDDVVCLIKEFWAHGDRAELSAKLGFFIRQSAKGDAFRAGGGDAQQLLEVFLGAFEDKVQRARSPAAQAAWRQGSLQTQNIQRLETGQQAPNGVLSEIRHSAAGGTATGVGIAVRAAATTADVTTLGGLQQHSGLAVALLDGNLILEAEHKAQLERARELLQKGHATLARDELESLRNRIWGAASAAVRARVLSLIGHAEFQLGRFESAGNALVSALEHAPQDSKIQANGALGHEMLGNLAAAREWAQKARSSDPTNLIALQLLILQDERDNATILAEHEAVVGRSAAIYFALGQRAARAHGIAHGVTWFRRAAELDGSDAEVLAWAGQSILGVVLERLDHSLGALEFNTDDRLHLSEAAQLLQTAWNMLKDDRVRVARASWLVGLGRARSMLGDRAGAVAASDEALRLDRDARDHLFFRAVLAHEDNDHKLVAELLDGKTAGDADAIGLLATARSNRSEYPEAVAAWRELLKEELSFVGRDQAERNLVLTLIAAGRLVDAKVAAVEFLGLGITLARQLLASEVAEHAGDLALRDGHLQEALALAPSQNQRWLLLRLGDALLRADRPGDAASVYERCVSPQDSEPNARRLLSALYQSGRFATALDLCIRRDQSLGANRLSAEFAAVIHEHLGDLPRARSVCEAHLAVYADDTWMHLRLAQVLYRIGDLPALSLALDRIALDDIAGKDVRLGTVYISLLSELERNEQALDALYEIRQRHLGEPEAHLLYVRHHSVLSRGLGEPSEVALGVAVRLAGFGAPTNWMLLTANATTAETMAELHIDHPLARSMLGTKVGDTFAVAGVPGRKWAIAEICSKYTLAHRQTLDQFGMRFPDDASIELHEVPQDIGEFIETLKRRMEDSTQLENTVLDAYGMSILTVGGVGLAFQKSIHDTLGFLVASPHGLIAADNTVEEKRDAQAALDQPDRELVLDLTALIILEAVEALTAVANGGRRCIVAQTTVDAIRRETKRWRDVPEEGFLSLGMRDGQMQRQHFTKADAAKNVEQLDKLLAWIRTHCAIVPVSAAVVENHCDSRDLAKLLDVSFADSLFLATDQNRILVSDDAKLRFIGKQLFGIDGVASIHLLLAQRAAGRLDRDAAATALMKLVASNYREVAVDATTLEAAARAAQWQPTGLFERVVNTLRGPGTQLESAIVVAVEFLRNIWFESLLPYQRDALTMRVMDALAAGRESQRVLSLTGTALAAKLFLLPHAATDYERVIASWARLHFQRG